MSFHDYLDLLLRKKDLKSIDVARRMGFRTSGIIYQWRTKRRPVPDPQKMQKLVEALECTKEESEKLMSFAVDNALGPHSKELTIGLHILPEKKYDLVPLLGSCPASPKEWVNDEVLEWLEFPKSIVQGRRLYLLKVIGDSMNKLAIDPGDTVIVDADRQPVNGDIVVICVDHEFTMKIFKKQGSTITLEPASFNPNHQTVSYNAGECDIRLRGVIWKIWMKDLKRR